MTPQQFFGRHRKTFRASAPGRLDVMGGIADYSGSLVLEMPIREATTVSVALRDDSVVRAHSTTAESLHFQPTVEVALSDCVNHDGSIEYAPLRERLAARESAGWAAYVTGCALVLMREKKAKFRGADFWIESSVPPGKGVSASAALEVAAMAALTKAMNLKLGDTELPMLCQMVENRVVGAPCGLMDQLTSYLGRKDQLLPILCQPADVQPPVAIPPGVSFVGIDSGVRHAVSGASYTDVRVAAFMGYTIIALHEGASLTDVQRARESGDASGLPYRGYLANVPVSVFEEKYRDRLPVKISGKSFLERYDSTIDSVTQVNKNATYHVHACARHPIYENHRVNLFSSLLHLLGAAKLKRDEREKTLNELGELMYQSHVSYSDCGLGNNVTNRIVHLARAAGPAKGVYGAKITGGGSGGTVCLLCAGRKGRETAARIAQTLAASDEKPHALFTGSSDGCRWRDDESYE
jgi:L-arabinokinase